MARFEIDFLAEYTDEALLSELRRVSVVLGGRALTQAAFKKTSGKVHPYTLIRRFGRWKEALAKAGLEHRFLARNYTDQECLENLASVWTQLGRCPQYREMNFPPSTVGAKAYLRWGKWRKAVQAFVEWANGDESGSAEPWSDEALQESSLPAAKRVRLSVEDRHEIPLRLKWKVHVRDNFRCVACGKNPPQHGVTLHADHIRPWVDGGKTVLENLQTLCEPCNLGKGRLYGKVT